MVPSRGLIPAVADATGLLLVGCLYGRTGRAGLFATSALDGMLFAKRAIPIVDNSPFRGNHETHNLARGRYVASDFSFVVSVLSLIRLCCQNGLGT